MIWRSDPRACAGLRRRARRATEPPELADARPQIADPIAAYQMMNMLTGVVQRGTGTAAGRGWTGRSPARPARRTTTSTTGSSASRPTSSSPSGWASTSRGRLGKGETGGSNAAPIFREVLEAALRDSPAVPFRAPPGVALVRMQDGGATILEAFKPGTENSARPVGGNSAGGMTAAGAEQSLGGLY